MNAIEHALLAVMAAGNGDGATACVHLARAQDDACATARRERQIVQIAKLVVSGQSDRAAGLTLEHSAEFPDDCELLARVARGAARRTP